MKTIQHKRLLAGLVLAVVAAAGAFAGPTGYGAAGAVDRTGLTVEQMLTYAIQDEYLAQAEYAVIMERYGTQRPFSNIIRAEGRHIEWLEELFREHGYTLPADEGREHAVVPASLNAAFEAGVKAEVDNIAMYEQFLAADLPADVRDVFERLKYASENHLRAFRRG